MQTLGNDLEAFKGGKLEECFVEKWELKRKGLGAGKRSACRGGNRIWS
jgi:hypothetical protein